MSRGRPQMEVGFTYDGGRSELEVNYVPVNLDGRTLSGWRGAFSLAVGSIERRLLVQLDTLLGILWQRLPREQVVFPDGTSHSLGRAALDRIMVIGSIPSRIRLLAKTTQGYVRVLDVEISELSPDAQRLFNDVIASCEAESWKHLANSIGVEISDRSMKVFISYRRRDDVQRFAEALAERLEREAVSVFFDKWDMRAGDSLPGKIEEAFATSRACIIILSKDHSEGQWATLEMRTAISKRVEESYRIIPVLFEDAPIPELLREAIRVDFRTHDPDQFEAKVREIIQALFGLTGRMYRSEGA